MKMRKDRDHSAGVTYVGPRAFVTAFCVVCAIFLGLFFGLNRVADRLEAGAGDPAPIVAATLGPRGESSIGSTANAPGIAVFSGPSASGRRARPLRSAAAPVTIVSRPAPRVVAAIPAKTAAPATLPEASPRSISRRHAEPPVPSRPARVSVAIMRPVVSPRERKAPVRLIAHLAATAPLVVVRKTTRPPKPLVRPVAPAPARRGPALEPGPILVTAKSTTARSQSPLLVPFNVGIAAHAGPRLAPKAPKRETLVVSPSAQTGPASTSHLTSP